ncbi:hypothetical protein B296_00022787 [Ensete ventricosum]|uniref:Uncharacterized protein n=1 Tax=Ensete ventricosum TaxID=4639 RepID=A0A426XMX9_ENSVE|nr:hypothetical protein B296_00022787 [Ensete ventricosum]
MESESKAEGYIICLLKSAEEAVKADYTPLARVGNLEFRATSMIEIVPLLYRCDRRKSPIHNQGVEGAVPDTTGGKEARGNSARYDRKELVTYQSHSRLGSPLWKKLSMRQGRKQMVEKNGAISKARMEYLSRG